MSMLNFYEFQDKTIKGRVEIFDNKGNLLKTVDNLILLSARLAMLYNIFKDRKIISKATEDGYIPEASEGKENYIPVICGFMFGNNGSNISNPSIIRVPSPIDNFTSDDNLTTDSTMFVPVPMIPRPENANNGGNGGNNSYQNTDAYLNNLTFDSDRVIDNTTGLTKYFSPSSLNDDDNFYCKSIDTTKSEIKINPTNFEIEYIIKFDITRNDLVGKSFSEIGLVMANCNLSNSGIITDIDMGTVCLASRLTFENMSLSKELASSFNIRYHIYI